VCDLDRSEGGLQCEPIRKTHPEEYGLFALQCQAKQLRDMGAEAFWRDCQIRMEGFTGFGKNTIGKVNMIVFNSCSTCPRMLMLMLHYLFTISPWKQRIGCGETVIANTYGFPCEDDMMWCAWSMWQQTS
jgi:hypothetical protein